MSQTAIPLGTVCTCGNRAGKHIVNGATVSVGWTKSGKLRKMVSEAGLGRCSACRDCKKFQRRTRPEETNG